MGKDQNFFHDNFAYMLDCLHATPHEISEHYEKFQNELEHQFKLREDRAFPSRSSLHQYQKKDGSLPRGKSLLAVVQFFNDNLQRNVSVKEFMSQPLDNMGSAGELQGLAGEYYGLFLNPDTKRGEREKRFCGAVLRIWNSGTEQAPVFRAQMAAEIREEELLFDRQILELFRQEDPGQAFEDFRKGLPGGQKKRFAYFEGEVSLADEVMICSLKGKTMPKTWSIHLNVGRMLKYLREMPDRAAPASFQGSMGGVLVTNDRDHGAYFMKFAILATRFREQFRLNHADILKCLGLGRNPSSVIKMNGEMDLEWHNFVSEKLDGTNGKNC